MNVQEKHGQRKKAGLQQEAFLTTKNRCCTSRSPELSVPRPPPRVAAPLSRPPTIDRLSGLTTYWTRQTVPDLSFHCTHTVRYFSGDLFRGNPKPKIPPNVSWAPGERWGQLSKNEDHPMLFILR